MRAHGPVMELPEASSVDHLCWEHAADEFVASGSRMSAMCAYRGDVAGCRALAGWAAAMQAGGVPLEVRGASALLQRMWRIPGLDDVAAVAFSAPRG